MPFVKKERTPDPKPCYDCGKPIFIVLMTQRGKFWPIDTESDAKLGWVFIQWDDEKGMWFGEEVKGEERRRLLSEDPELASRMLDLHRPHFQTCESDRAKKNREKFYKQREDRKAYRQRYRAPKPKEPQNQEE